MLLIQWLVGILGAGLPSGEHVVSTWKRAFALLRVFFRCLRNVGIRRPKASLICSLAFDAVPSRFYLDQFGEFRKRAVYLCTAGLR